MILKEGLTTGKTLYINPLRSVQTCLNHNRKSSNSIAGKTAERNGPLRAGRSLKALPSELEDCTRGGGVAEKEEAPLGTTVFGNMFQTKKTF